MHEGLIIIGVCWLLFIVSQLLPPMKMKWAEGWFFPHTDPQERCLFKCGTCSKGV